MVNPPLRDLSGPGDSTHFMVNIFGVQEDSVVTFRFRDLHSNSILGSVRIHIGELGIPEQIEPTTPNARLR